MYERFTDRARRVVILAQEEVRLFGHTTVGTEHLLLGLIREGDGIAARVLTSLGFTIEGLRTQVEEIIGQGEERLSGHIPFTPRAKKVIELSLREALQLGHNYVGTEHLLLGLIREGEGVGAQMLERDGTDLISIRRAVIEHLNGLAPQPVRSSGSVCSTDSDAVVKWGPTPAGYTIRAEASVDAVDDLIKTLISIRDDLANVNDAVRLLEKFGFAVTPPPVLSDEAQVTVD